MASGWHPALHDRRSQRGLVDVREANHHRRVVEVVVVDREHLGMRVQPGRAILEAAHQRQGLRIAQKEEQLRASEARRVDFERNSLGLLPGVGSVQTRMEAARSELNQIDSSLMAAQGALAAINGQMGGVAPSVAGPGTVDGRVAALEGQIADAQSRGWTDSHPDMQALKAQLARARASASRSGGGYASPNPAYT